MVGVIVVVLVGLRRGIVVCGPPRDCLSTLIWADGRRDLDVDEDGNVNAGTT